MYFTELSRVSKSLEPPKIATNDVSSSERSPGPSSGGSQSVADKLKVKMKAKDRPSIKLSAKSAIDPSCVPPEVFGMGITFDPAASAVPKTIGIKLSDDAESCLIIFFADGNRERKSRAIFAEMYKHKVSAGSSLKQLFMCTYVVLSISSRTSCWFTRKSSSWRWSKPNRFSRPTHTTLSFNVVH